MKKRTFSIMIILLVLFTLAGCSSTPKVTPLVPGDYPDPPQDERQVAQRAYVAWDGVNGESWEYAFSAGGSDIIKEGSAPPAPESEDGKVILFPESPGGITLWFWGVSPGDAVVTFTVKSGEGKVVNISQIAFRVYDDLTVALLHEESNSFR